MVYKQASGIRYYEGDVTPGPGVVFVFGSNPEGRHGLGAAKVARDRFGAIYGQGEGFQGNSYAIPTKDLLIRNDYSRRSISPEDITASIRRFYDFAASKPDLDFYIAYRNTDSISLNGYTGMEMIRMFADAGRLPGNVAISREWYEAGADILRERPAGRRADSLVLAREMAAEKERSMKDGTFMLSHDGRPTALTESEWLATRTPTFRRLYGNWEGDLLDRRVREGKMDALTGEMVRRQAELISENGEDLLERIPPEALASNVGRGGRAVEAAMICRADGSTDSVVSPSEGREDEALRGRRQEAALEAWAKMNGLWTENTDAAFSPVDAARDGHENDIYSGGDGQTVVKAMSLAGYVSPQLALDRVLLHNHLFPGNAMSVEGFGRDASGGFRIIVRQPFLKEDPAAREQIRAFIEELDLIPVGRPKNMRSAGSTNIYYGDGFRDAEAVLAHAGTAVSNPEIRLNTPGLGKGGSYVIPTRERKYVLSESLEPRPEDIRRALGVPKVSRTLLLSPSGQESNLPCGLYALVRSQEFISRHGDWTKGESHLVLDGNGEPAVLWHGTAAMFEHFDMSHAGDNTGLVEYTDKARNEKIQSDSSSTISFSDSREQALSYALLGWTNRLRTREDDLRTASVALRKLWTDRDLIPVFENLRNEFPDMAELGEVDFSKEKPISSLPEDTRLRIASAIEAERVKASEAYRLGFNASAGSPISNMMRNIDRQADYFHYFRDNIERLRHNDASVRTERLQEEPRDFTTMTVHFYGKEKCPESSVWLDGDTGAIMFRATCLGGSVRADSITDEQKDSFLKEIQNGIDDAVRQFNEAATNNGFAEHSHLHPAFVRMEKPMNHDYRFSSFPDKYKPNNKYDTAYVAARQVAKAVGEGCDGVVMKNIVDPFPGTTYGVFSTEQIYDIKPELLEAADMRATLNCVAHHTGADMNRGFAEPLDTDQEKKREDAFRSLARRAVESGKVRSVGDLHDGWALVESMGGAFNYTDAEGKFMTKDWFSEAKVFDKGRALVKRNGTTMIIDAKGTVVSLVSQDRKTSSEITIK